MTDRAALYAIERLFLDSTSEDYPFTEEFDTACNNAISALKEREERSRGCEFCTILYTASDWGGLNHAPHSFRVSGDKLFYRDSEYGWEGIGIKYCPMCGRPLKKEKA